MELPKILEKMLEATLDTSSLHSWNIYQDKDGYINFRLKFRSHGESPMHDCNTGYRRKTNNQIQRDQDRSRAWQAKKAYASSSKTNHPQEPSTVDNDSVAAGVRTRSMANNEATEVLRTSDPLSPLNPFADPFVIPVKTPVPTQPSPAPTILLPSPQPSQTVLQEEVIQCQAELECSATLSNIPSISDTDDEADVDSSRQSDSDDWCDCEQDYFNCTYATGPNTKINANIVYKCSKCPGTTLCVECLTKGNHKRHKKYLKEQIKL